MKRILTIITILISTQIYAQNYDSTLITDNGKLTTHIAIDSAIPSTIEDTAALTFKQVYGDVKAALTGLSEGLKVGAEHVYEILVKQQIIYSITYLIILIFGVIISVISIIAGQINDWESPITAIGTGIGITITLISLLLIQDIVTGFCNPEYGAIKEILNVIK